MEIWKLRYFRIGCGVLAVLWLLRGCLELARTHYSYVPRAVIIISEPWASPDAAAKDGCVWVSPTIQGHFAVTSLTILDLQRAGLNVLYNPTCWWKSDKTNVVILTNAEIEGNVAVNLKKSGRAGIVLAGPNLDFTTAKGGENFDAVDGWIMPSQGVSDNSQMYRRQEPSRSLVWPVGVDEDRWTPSRPRREKNGSYCIIYLKTKPPPLLLANVVAVVEQQGLSVRNITYSSYTAEEYLKALRGAYVMIVFSVSESQGVFLAEAWSTNVPTYVYAGNSWQHSWNGKLWLSSPSPYLSPLTGAFFNNEEQLLTLLKYDAQFRPREWLLKHQSSRVIGKMMRESMEVLLRNRQA